MRSERRSIRMGLGILLIASAGGLPTVVSGLHAMEGPATEPRTPVPESRPPAPSAPSPAVPRLALLKNPPVGASTYPWHPDYLRVLERFPAYHARNWHEVEVAGETLGYFGTGDRGGARMQASALLALAYLAAEPGYDPRPTGVPAAALRTQALRSLRHLLRTHVIGDLERVGGGRWGGDREASLVIPPLAAASRLLAPHLTPHVVAGVERALVHEANRLLEQSPAAGKPRESRAADNAADAECLAWAAAQMPEHANASRWEQQVRRFAMNTLSALQDRVSEAAVDSRPLREWVVAENLLPDFLLESGGAVNPDAALRTLASLSGGYYAYITCGRPVPAALTHHFEDTWEAIRRLWLGGHRFARPAAGSSGAGGERLVLPVTALLEWVGSEPSVARMIERNCFRALEGEQTARGDGSFFGGRAGAAAEAEAAASAVLAGLIHRRHGALVMAAAPGPLKARLAGAWTSPAAALAVARSPSCFASWSWRSLNDPTAPVGLFVPLEAEGLAAWGPDQLVGSFELQDFTPSRRLHRRERTIEGGFTATGQIEEGLKEGRSALHHFVAFAALPAERVAVVFDLALAAQGVTVTRSEGLRLRLPNDAAGGSRRTLRSDEGELTVTGIEPGQPAVDRLIASSWLNIDNQLGVASLYSQAPFVLRDIPVREGAMGDVPTTVIDNPFSTQAASYQAGQIVRDTVMLLIAGDAATTARLARAGAVLTTGNELVRAAVITGAEGGRYLVAANFGLKETRVNLRPPAVAPLTDLRLAPLDTLVLRLQQ